MLRRLVKVWISSAVYLMDVLIDLTRSVCGLRSRGKVVVLYYHGISSSELAGFTSQMRTLARTVRLTTCSGENINGGNHHAAVSFDDGFVSVFENALPVLRCENIPSTIFIPTDYMGEAPRWIEKQKLKDRGERVVTSEQLLEFAADPLVAIGSHTRTHARIPNLTLDQATDELCESKRLLEGLLGKPVTLFSFPHGAYSERDLRLVRQAGYKRAFGVQPTLAFTSRDEFVTGRVACDPLDWPLEFRLKIAGAYRWQSLLQRNRTLHS